MAARPLNELVYDSEASLRLVERALDEFGPIVGDTADMDQAETVRGVIFDELMGLIAHLRPEDISATQLAHASQVIAEMEKLYAQIDQVPTLSGDE
ncbi:MAG: hypothetical protein ABJE10_22865 [bacterium]